MTLYCKLKGKAWDDAEEIDVEKLRQEDTALEYFEEWIRKHWAWRSLRRGRSCSPSSGGPGSGATRTCGASTASSTGRWPA
eukprot:2832584-Alexandrium_andersonii.AAC.1